MDDLFWADVVHYCEDREPRFKVTHSFLGNWRPAWAG